jgi:geranylgeranylglycerol-phosphate geranylgeranyltransferase
MKALVRLPILCRPINCLITFLSVWVGAMAASGIYFSDRILAAAISAALIAAFGNIVNDLFDIKADSINKPFRPLARGDVSKSIAVALAIVLAIIGFALSFYVDGYAWFVALAAIVLLLAYTPIFKGLNYLGNLLVAMVGAMAFIYGGMAVDRPLGAFVLIVFAFLLHLGREIIKDIQDKTADNAAGRRTGASIADGLCSRCLASLVLVLLIVATLTPYFLRIYGLGYLMIVIVVDLLLAESVRRLIISGDSAESLEVSARRVSGWLKLAMPLGLLAVLVGRLGL